MKPILLLGPVGDRETDAVAAALDAVGHPYARRSATDPVELALEGTTARWRWDGLPDAVVDVRAPDPAAFPFGAIWLRTLRFAARFPRQSAAWTPETAYRESFWDAEIGAFKAAFLQHAELCGVPVINPIAPMQRAQSKVAQLLELARVGARVPSTLVTQAPDAARRFAGDGPTIFKAVAQSAQVRKVRPVDLSESRLAMLARAPVAFQRAVGDRDVRVYMFDGQVLAALMIQSRKDIDSRQHTDGAEPVELAAPLVGQLHRAMLGLGLRFSGIDVRVTAADGPPYDGTVLELNSSPMFATYAAMSGLPIAAGVARGLVTAASEAARPAPAGSGRAP